MTVTLAEEAELKIVLVRALAGRVLIVRTIVTVLSVESSYFMGRLCFADISSVKMCFCLRLICIHSYSKLTVCGVLFLLRRIANSCAKMYHPIFICSVIILG